VTTPGARRIRCPTGQRNSGAHREQTVGPAGQRARCLLFFSFFSFSFSFFPSPRASISPDCEPPTRRNRLIGYTPDPLPPLALLCGSAVRVCDSDRLSLSACAFPLFFFLSDHHTTGQYPPCGGAEYPTPACPTACDANSTYTTPFAKDKHRFNSSYSIAADATQIMQEIMTNGPVEAAFSVYADFEACPYTQKMGGWAFAFARAAGENLRGAPDLSRGRPVPTALHLTTLQILAHKSNGLDDS